MESQSKETKAEKKAIKKATKKATKKVEREEKLVMEEEERERKRLKREGQTVWPLLKFIDELGEFPWNDLANNWGFKEGSESFELLPTKVAPPNDKIRTIRGLHADWSDKSGGYVLDDDFEEASKVSISPLFTYNDLASAVYEAAIEQGAGGHICSVISADQCKDDPTVIDVKFDIRVYCE